MNKPRTLMVQGTTSDAGKTTLVAGLCRLFARRKMLVAPFKPQNMALNSAVTPDGGEIGRAQALQAQAANIDASVDMNPVLLKPNSDIGAQVIVQGRSVGNMDAKAYHAYKPQAMRAVLQSHQRLCEQFDLVVVEGAGSPAEINLRDGDIANMGFAEAVDCPVILIADIDRGGVFAHIVGTLELLSESERRRVCGFVINRFRGDIKLLESGLHWLEKRTGKPVLGVLPYLSQLHLDAEDAIDRSQTPHTANFRVVVPVLPRISNHTDFDPLRRSPGIEFQYVGPGQAPPPADLVILPGSKSVRDDLDHLRRQGWPAYLQKHLRYGGKLLGICGGFQMLGQSIDDPHGIESAPGTSPGLGLLDFNTQLAPNKQLRRQSGRLLTGDIDANVEAYEIHCGVSQGPALDRPMIQLADGTDGAISADDQIAGTYLHGLFDTPAAQAAVLAWAGHANAQAVDVAVEREAALNRLADALEAHLDLPALNRLLSA